MQTDPVGDMLTVVRNGYTAGKKVITISHSGLKEDVLNILKDEGYIEDVEIVAKQDRSMIMATLRYVEQKKPALERIRRVSKPGRRVYVQNKKIPFVRNGYGVSIISTSRGVMTDRKAREQGVGGEIICELW